MRTGSSLRVRAFDGGSRRAPRSSHGRIGGSCAALIAFAAMALPASALANHHTAAYSLTVVAGETNFPEHIPVAGVSASVENTPSKELVISIIREGTTVFRSSPEGEDWASLSQVPEVGEVVTLESPVGKLIGSEVYDGLPTIDPTVCAGSNNFSGGNTSGFTVEGSYTTYGLQFGPYGEYRDWKQLAFGEAQVKSLTGTSYGGNFLIPLAAGETVAARESLKTRLAEEATYTYTSEVVRPVGACPAPPPPPPSPPPPPVLSGSIFKLLGTSIHKLLHAGWSDLVSINQPGTVTQDVYLDSGKIPAVASSTRHHHHKALPPAMLLARGSATASAAGTVTVKLALTRTGRRKLKSAKRVTVVVLTTLTTAGGQKLSLGRRTLKLKH